MSPKSANTAKPRGRQKPAVAQTHSSGTNDHGKQNELLFRKGTTAGLVTSRSWLDNC